MSVKERYERVTGNKWSDEVGCRSRRAQCVRQTDPNGILSFMAVADGAVQAGVVERARHSLAVHFHQEKWRVEALQRDGVDVLAQDRGSMAASGMVRVKRSGQAASGEIVALRALVQEWSQG